MRIPIDLSPFSSSTRTRWIPKVGAHLRARYEDLIKQLMLEARAHREGDRNHPLVTDTELDAAEREILNAVEANGNALRQFLDACLDQARGLIQRRVPAPMDAELAVAQATVGLDRSRLEDELKLKDLWKAKTRASRQMEGFKRKHWLSREAAFSDDPAKPWILPVALLIGESVLNVGAFQAAGGGLAGGAMAAVSFSLINVVLGFATGACCIRSLWHRAVAVRVLGVIGTLAMVALAIWVNSFIAHYRDLLEATQNHDVGGAFDRAATLTQLGGLEPTGIGLLLLGLIFYAVALQKGIGGEDGLFDPYWLYVTHARPWRRACAAYDEARTACLDRLKAEAAVFETGLRARLKAEAEAVIEAKDIAAQAVERADEICDSLTEWRDMSATLLTYYRNENMAVRTDPPPAYFKTFPDLRAMLRGLPDGRDLVDLAVRSGEIRDANVATSEFVERELARRYADLYGRFVARIEELEALAKAELDAEERAARVPSTADARFTSASLAGGWGVSNETV